MNDKDPKLERSAAENAAPEQTEGTPGKKPSAARARKKRELSERISGYSADYRGAYGERREMDDLPEDPEIDDFLPEGEGSMDEKMLSKWEDDFGPEEETPEAEEEKPKEKKKKHGHRRYGVPVGIVVLLLALVGVGFIAGTIANSIYRSATDDSQLRAYDTMLTPIVMQDPPAFEGPGNADAQFVLNASVWKTILANNATNYTNYDDVGRVIVPLSDVVDSCHELFGSDCDIQTNAGGDDTFYQYDASDNTFHIALFSSDSTFQPYTESASRQGDEMILRVGYVSPTDEWRTQTTSKVEKPTPTKYMQYILRTDEKTNKTYVYAVRSEETASSSASSK